MLFQERSARVCYTGSLRQLKNPGLGSNRVETLNVTQYKRDKTNYDANNYYRKLILLAKGHNALRGHHGINSHKEGAWLSLLVEAIFPWLCSLKDHIALNDSITSHVKSCAVRPNVLRKIYQVS